MTLSYNRSHVPIDQLLTAIKQFATRPRNVQCSGDAGWLDATAQCIRETIKRGEEFNCTWLAGVCDRMEMISQNLMNLD